MAPSTGDRLVYAVGDIHGRLDLLRPLIEDIAADAHLSAQKDRPLLVFLGDYVDRGPHSRKVIDLILWLIADGHFEVCALKGNHEEALLKFLDTPSFGSSWIEHGGAPTLVSYGVQPPTRRTDPDAWVETREEFAAAVPQEHKDFFENLSHTAVVGDYVFVHAGVRPGVPLSEQEERDLLWIRQDFLASEGPFEKVVVHGHTPSEAPQLLAHRLGIDTGAYATGVLTAIRLHGADQQTMQSVANKS